MSSPVKWVATSRAEQNSAALDPWSVVHFASGLALGLVGVSMPVGLAAGVAYEIVEHAAEKDPRWQQFFLTTGPESQINIVTDLVLLAGGLALGKRWRET